MGFRDQSLIMVVEGGGGGATKQLGSGVSSEVLPLQ